RKGGRLCIPPPRRAACEARRAGGPTERLSQRRAPPMPNGISPLAAAASARGLARGRRATGASFGAGGFACGARAGGAAAASGRALRLPRERFVRGRAPGLTLQHARHRARDARLAPGLAFSLPRLVGVLGALARARRGPAFP